MWWVMQANLMDAIKSPIPVWQLISCRGQAGISFLIHSCPLSKFSFKLLPSISKCFAFLIVLLHAPVRVEMRDNMIPSRALGKLRH